MSSIPTQVRIDTAPERDKAHRYEAIERAKEELDCGSMTNAVVLSCEHVRQDKEAKRKAIEYLSDRLPAPAVEEVAELLSTRHIEITIEPRKITIE